MTGIARRVTVGLVAVLVTVLAMGFVPVGAASPSPWPPTSPYRWVNLTTRPALPNATFTLDGVAYTTGPDGTVVIPTSTLTGLEQRLSFVSVVDAPLTHAIFSHFEAQPEIAYSRTVVAAFDMSRFLHIRTLPALPRATFLLDGTSYTTGADGTVTVATDRLSDLDHRLKFDTLVTDSGTRARFLRFSNPPQHGYWRDAIAVFDLSRAVQFSFAKPDGSALPPGRVSSMTIRSSTGVDRTISDSALRNPVMLPALHVTSTNETRDQQMIRYTVQEVRVDGSNTVVPSQQAFFPANTTAAAVGTRIYSLDVTVDDAIFGFSAGSSVLLRKPDGSESRYHLADGKVTIPGLAPGQYQMRIQGAGFDGWRPIVVSRDQVIAVSPISGIDIAAVGAIALLLLFGLFFVGARRRARRRSTLPEPNHTGTGDPWSRPPAAGAPAPVRASEPTG